MKVTNVKIWKSYPYMDGSAFVWGPGAQLPAPDYDENVEIQPSKDRLFSEIRIPLDYHEYRTANYIALYYESGSHTEIWYGWIDKVTLMADGDTNKLIAINWHPDLWRMWMESAVFGAGIVQRQKMTGASTEQFPPQEYPVRYWLAKSKHRMDSIVNGDITKISAWAYISVITNGATSELKRYCWPVSIQDDCFLDVTTTSYPCPTLDQTLNGKWDEALGIDPDTVTGAWISPISPVGTSVYTDNNQITINWGGGSTIQLGGKKWVKEWSYENNGTAVYSATTTDSRRFNIVGWDGEVIGTTPWGVPIRDWLYHTVINSTTAYVVLQASSGAAGYGDQSTNGLRWTIPLVPIDVTTNAVSSYNLSGAREADKMQIKLDADKARVSGHLNTVNSAIGGGVAGGLMGAGPLGAAAGMAGAALGAVGNIVTTEVQYRYATGEFADRTIGINDYRAAHQANNLIMSGSPEETIYHGIGGLYIVKAERDDYSDDVMTADINLYGAHCSNPMQSCDALIRAGGPVQIANCCVTGNIPPDARAYIKNRLAKGVVIG